jgi:hypothetical protein
VLTGNQCGFVYSHGVYRDITVPGVVGTGVNSINNRGQLAGAYGDSDGTIHGYVRDRDGNIETVDHPDAAGLGTAVYAINGQAELTGAYLTTGTRSPSGVTAAAAGGPARG